MKSGAKLQILFFMLVFGICMPGADHLRAQNLRMLHSFQLGEGVFPTGLVLSGNIIYGTASMGGSWNDGTVFSVNKDGSALRVLYSFNSSHPGTICVSSNNLLYGIENNGAVFVLNTDGTGFRNLSLVPVVPRTGLVISGNTLYGTAEGGGGVVFKLSTDGTGFTNLHTFTESRQNSSGFSTNGDAAGPNYLIMSSNMLYGTAGFGGNSGLGAVFAINSNGTDFTILHSFAAGSGSFPLGLPRITNSDGAFPNSLVLSGNTLYGTAPYGGGSANGTIFAVNTDGSDFRVLHAFAAGSGSYIITNSDGVYANELILSGNTLYGAADLGGAYGIGTIFSLNSNGTDFTTLYSFGGIIGGRPSGVLLSDNTFYGTTEGGYNGALFSLSFPPQLSINPSTSNIILSWPTNYAGFDYTTCTLQSTTNLASVAWATNLPSPVVVDGHYTVTNPVSGTQQLFRLSQPLKGKP